MATTDETTERTTTEYVVLELRSFTDDDGTTVNAWVEAGRTAAGTRTAVVSEIAGDKEAIWRPVPVRNWGSPIRTRNETSINTKVEVMDDDVVSDAE